MGTPAHQSRFQHGIHTEGAREAGPIREVDLQLGPIALVLVDPKHLDRLAAKFWTFNVLIGNHCETSTFFSRVAPSWGFVNPIENL